jgi:C1A family cysteine protease
MRKLQLKRRSSLVLIAALVLVAVTAGLACAATIKQMQVRPELAIREMPETVILLPQARLLQVKQGKQVADVNVLKQTYFVRNDIPFIRGDAGEEFALIPLSKMEYTPSGAEVTLATRLPGKVVRYAPYINAGAVIAEIPKGVDHRSEQTPVKNQSGRGTCVCFASMAGLEVEYGGGTLDLSENYANYLYMKAEGRVCKDDGLQTHMSADYLTDHGVCAESVCPYQTSFPGFCNNGANPAPTQRANAEAHSPYKIKSYQKMFRNDSLTTDTGIWINNPRYLEALLRSGKDIVFGTHVAGWTYPYTGVIDVKLTSGGNPLPSVGGHAMLVVGYNRIQEYFIVKNSWGTSKGQSGYVYLSYDYIRTYAKYGYVINEVEPVAMRALRPMLRAIPMMVPSD